MFLNYLGKCKLACSVCKKLCKDEAVKYDDKYYHTNCFTCQVCGIQLPTSGFYKNEDKFYCHDDYQQSFGKRCQLCNNFTDGEVFTALDLVFHKACFFCYSCSTPLEPGNTVIYLNNKFLCSECFHCNDNINEKDKKAILAQESYVENTTRLKKDQECNVDYGKFYKKSFLEQTTSPFRKAASINASEASPRHFHRPENFSYTQVGRDFIKQPKRESEIAFISKAACKPAMDSVVVSISNKEAVRLSKLPDAQLKPKTELNEEDVEVVSHADSSQPKIEKNITTSVGEKGEKVDDPEKKDGDIDPITGLKRLRPNPAFSVYSSLSNIKPSLIDLFKKEQIYPYEELKFSNFKMPSDVERESVENFLFTAMNVFRIDSYFLTQFQNIIFIL
ncbi:hypothetical protein HELRODRAFT_190526 [Helobdella robusta]|uniref:LIM zinc-binding domain-containing protein n=1 Tax=Helobdella robusta TaxID=6412 RepID=T1FS26_HELRO|nr:hypothetical protein HELRODRAFT_190526 [Helobdella robusta]ESO09507.1 hypothetical protein HELRODRAFT_190526 [Helobdella robusta]